MTLSLISKLRKPHLLRRVWRKLLSGYYNEQWITLISQNAQWNSPKWKVFKPLLPPLDRDWADPFLWKHEGNDYVFIEEKLFSSKNAHISCLLLDKDLKVVSSQIVLQRPYHLSYPFLFTHKDQLFMMPETMNNRAVELYRCIKFPDQWEFYKTLIPDMDAVDATLFEKDGKWWLFANIQDKNGSTWTELHLFSSDSPTSNSWKPHPQNPIVQNVRSSRPAGHILNKSGTLIRPSQDSSVRYGYATNFMRITTLTGDEYSEERVNTFKPPSLRNILGVHTWNELDNLTVIDAFIRRKKQ